MNPSHPVESDRPSPAARRSRLWSNQSNTIRYRLFSTVKSLLPYFFQWQEEAFSQLLTKSTDNFATKISSCAMSTKVINDKFPSRMPLSTKLCVRKGKSTGRSYADKSARNPSSPPDDTKEKEHSSYPFFSINIYRQRFTKQAICFSDSD